MLVREGRELVRGWDRHNYIICWNVSHGKLYYIYPHVHVPPVYPYGTSCIGVYVYIPLWDIMYR